MQEDHIPLKVKNLSLSFQTETERVRAVDQVSFSLKKRRNIRPCRGIRMWKNSDRLSFNETTPSPRRTYR